MCAEVMRCDEVGVVVAGGQQVTLVRHEEKRPPHGAFKVVSDQDYPGFSRQHLFDFLKLNSSTAKSIVSGFELLLYRPQKGQLYTPLRYSGYKEAVAGCDHQLFFLMSLLYVPQQNSILCIAQVEKEIYQGVLERKIHVGDTTLISLVDSWTSTVYSDAMAEQRYQALMAHPLAEPPADYDDRNKAVVFKLDNAN